MGSNVEDYNRGQANADRQRVLDKARSFLKGNPIASQGLKFSTDPVGFVRAAYWEINYDLFAKEIADDPNADGVEILYRSGSLRNQLHKHQPRPADLIFLDTKPGTLHPSQVALVESVEKNGTIKIIGFFANGAQRLSLNLRTPQAHRIDKVVVNDYVEGPSPILVAQTFRAFVDPF